MMISRTKEGGEEGRKGGSNVYIHAYIHAFIYIREESKVYFIDTYIRIDK